MKKLTTAALCLASATVMMAVAPQAEAEVVSNAETKVGVTLDDYGKQPGPFEDNLAFVYIPYEMNFGVKPVLTGNTASYVATPKNDYVVINDDRPADQAGNTSKWNATAKFSKFTKGGVSTGDQIGAELALTLDDIQGYLIGDDRTPSGSDIDPAPISAQSILPLPKSDDIQLGGTAETKQTVITLVAGGDAVPVMSKTKANAVKDGFLSKISKEQLKIINAKDKEGTFSGTIAWVLDDTL